MKSICSYFVSDQITVRQMWPDGTTVDSGPISTSTSAHGTIKIQCWSGLRQQIFICSKPRIRQLPTRELWNKESSSLHWWLWWTSPVNSDKVQAQSCNTIQWDVISRAGNIRHFCHINDENFKYVENDLIGRLSNKIYNFMKSICSYFVSDQITVRQMWPHGTTVDSGPISTSNSAHGTIKIQCWSGWKQ